jgi:hypothetical protein
MAFDFVAGKLGVQSVGRRVNASDPIEVAVGGSSQNLVVTQLRVYTRGSIHLQLSVSTNTGPVDVTSTFIVWW